MTLKDFSSVFGVLALQLRAMDVDEATVRAYYEAMKEQSLDAVKCAAVALAKETDRRFFPTTAEWLSKASVVRANAFRKELTAGREEPWKLECERCEDTGWTIHTCSGDRFCGRTKKHAPHDFARVCPCRPTNHTYQRHQFAGRGASE